MLAAIVAVAVVYSVTIFAINPQDRTPETAFGAMTAAFTVIGTLVGTYFGIKAGLDGQEKVRKTASRAISGSREGPQVSTERMETGGEGYNWRKNSTWAHASAES